jgi:3',5'-cyclic AMP phosphodiesterase CpdA
MSLVLHISDPHFGTERAEVTTALLNLAQQYQPDVAIVSGDITQRARRSQFNAAHRFLSTLAAPVKIVIPGNHDIPLFNLAARVFNPYGNYRHVFGESLEPQFANKDVLVIGVNTTRPRRHKDGEVSTQQIARVAGELQRALPHQLCIVVVHQPVFVEREADRKDLLHSREPAIQAWAEAGADLILSGHIHLPYVRQLSEPDYQLRRALWTVSAGTAVSKRVREGQPNSVNLIRYDAWKIPRICEVQQLDFNVLSGEFEEVQTTLIEPSLK